LELDPVGCGYRRQILDKPHCIVRHLLDLMGDDKFAKDELTVSDGQRIGKISVFASENCQELSVALLLLFYGYGNLKIPMNEWGFQIDGTPKSKIEIGEKKEPFRVIFNVIVADTVTVPICFMYMRGGETGLKVHKRQYPCAAKLQQEKNSYFSVARFRISDPLNFF
ncbi:hypothetical protein ACJX0J_028642, partial [Zea mays]